MYSLWFLFCFWLTVSGWVYRSKRTPVTLAVMQALHILSSFSNRIYRLVFHSVQSIHCAVYLFTIFQELYSAVTCGRGICKVAVRLRWLIFWHRVLGEKQSKLTSIWHHVRLTVEHSVLLVEALCCYKVCLYSRWFIWWNVAVPADAFREIID